MNHGIGCFQCRHSVNWMASQFFFILRNVQNSQDVSWLFLFPLLHFPSISLCSSSSFFQVTRQMQEHEQDSELNGNRCPVTTHETAAPEAPYGPGEQTESGDGWTPAETGQRTGGPEEQLCCWDGETCEEKPSIHRKRCKCAQDMSHDLLDPKHNHLLGSTKVRKIMWKFTWKMLSNWEFPSSFMPWPSNPVEDKSWYYVIKWHCRELCGNKGGYSISASSWQKHCAQSCFFYILFYLFYLFIFVIFMNVIS